MQELFRQTDQPIEERIKDLLSRMTLEEKFHRWFTTPLPFPALASTSTTGGTSASMAWAEPESPPYSPSDWYGRFLQRGEAIRSSFRNRG